MHKFYYNKLKKNPKKLQFYAKNLLPGVSQLFGKRPELYLPGGNWPTYYSKSKGVDVWGINNQKFIDFTMVGVGTSVLGYSDPDVNKAGIDAIKSGLSNTLNCPEDIELAELLLKQHSWAENVKYCRTGGESMSVAIRLSRAYNKRDKILFCGYHGWHDWYLSANLKNKKILSTHLLRGLDPLGVPNNMKNLTIPFRFNNYEDLEKIVKKNAKNSAAIVLEPCRDTLPDKEFLKSLRTIATKNNCVLIFDEITSGWRINNGGSHLSLNVNPDLAVFGKTIANGAAMGAIIGKKKIMKNITKTFISSVFWTEKIGPACAVAFIKKYERLGLEKILIKKGKKIKSIWSEAAKYSNLDIKISGIDPLATFKLNVKNWPACITYFIQEMLKKNILASDKCYANYMHSDKYIQKYKKACFEVFYEIAKLNKMNNLEKKLEGPVKQIDFSRLTDEK